MAEDVQVRDNSGASRYEILVDGRVAGFSEYVLHGSEADFVHTQIDDEFSGHGLATRLIGAALDDARRRGRRVMPYCQFVRAFIAEHPDYADLVPDQHRGRFGLAS